MNQRKTKKIAVLIPCFNEEKTIAGVVTAFQSQLPDADIYVFDNNSVDNTVSEAKKAGAIVSHEKKQGKGNVVRSMFRQVEADIYVMVDGDGTYPAHKVWDLINPVMDNEADMVIGSRLMKKSAAGFKPLNLLGNKLFLFIMNAIFGVRITDLLSGYRAFNSLFVKSVLILSSGFEIETELTLKCLDRGYRILEVPVVLTPRTQGSESKINIIRDGLLITDTIFSMFRHYKPLKAFGFIGLFILLCGFVPGAVVIREFINTGLILRIPSAILAVGLVLSGLFVIFAGMILDTISKRFKEIEYQLIHVIEKLHEDDSVEKVVRTPPKN